MKKVMFTAIAMIAFVGSSMANTIADEEKGIIDDSAKTSKIQEDATASFPYLTRCDRIYFTTLQKAFTEDFSESEAVQIAAAAWHTCNEIEASRK